MQDLRSNPVRKRRVGWLALGIVAALVAVALPAAAGAHTESGARTTTASVGRIAGVVPARSAFAPRAAPAAGTPNALYGGGPVMRTNTVYAIYWQPPGTTVSAHYQSLLDGYFQNVADSSGAVDNVYSNDTQYYDTTGTIAHASTFGGSYVDTANAIPTTCRSEYQVSVVGCVSQEDEQDEILRVLTATGWTPGPDTMFFLFTPQNVGSCTEGFCAYDYFCGYHSTFDTTVAGEDTPVIWANLPYPTMTGFPSDVCDAGEHPNGDIADATINIVSHEHIESITDPDTETGWIDSDGEEIADKCEWTFGDPLGTTGTGHYNEQIGTGKYYLQQEWSNGLTDCVQRPPDPPELLVSSFSPAQGSAGQSVSIYGVLMDQATGVQFGGADASFTHVGPTQLLATVPADGSTGPITVTTAGDSADSPGAFVVNSSIGGLSESTGQVGDEVVITGTSLGDASSVRFGAVEADFDVDSATQITAQVPVTALTGPITIVTSSGTLKGPVFHVRPTLDPLAVTTGAVGATVALTGQTLAGTSKVTFGASGAAGTLLTVTSVRVTVKVPANAVTGPITVTNPGGSTSTAQDFVVLSKITSFSPGSGVALAPVTINGSGLAGTTKVAFNGTAATISSITGTKVVALVPGAATTGPLVVTTAGPHSLTAGTFKPLPKLTGATPNPAQAGDGITLQGTNLAGARSLKLGGTALPLLTAATLTVTTKLRTNAATGTLTLVTATGTTTLTIHVRPTIASFSPASGKAGATVTITGKALQSPTKVTFGTGAATARISSSSYTKLVVRVPANAVTGPITVTTAGGLTASSASFTVTP